MSTVPPDSAAIIRVQINPEKKGAFQEDVAVFFGHLLEPVTLSVSGRMTEMPADMSLECPTFGHEDVVGNSRHFKVIVLDSTTLVPIKNASLQVVYAGKVIFEGKTDRNGEQRLTTPPGYTLISVASLGYKPNYFQDYIGKGQTEIKVLLANTSNLDVEEQHEVFTELESPVPVIPAQTPSAQSFSFSEHEYNPNNIVFLLDVSSSMGLHQRMEILQKGMLSLIEILRPIDKVSIVAYADNAEVLLPSTSGVEKQMLTEMVNSLKAKGSTAGGDGIKLAYQVAKKNYIPKGNNIVILITDGAFNTGDMQYIDFIKKSAKKGIVMTTIGIKTGQFSAMSLQEVASAAKGRYVAIDDNDESADKLIQEIKTGSVKK
jgi:Ca-activated chloride channel family protein